MADFVSASTEHSLLVLPLITMNGVIPELLPKRGAESRRCSLFGHRSKGTLYEMYYLF